MTGEPRQRRPLAAVYGDEASPGAWLVAETPDEAVELVLAAVEAGAHFTRFTLANPDDELDDDDPRWNGRPVHVKTSSISAVGPPLARRGGDD